MGRSADLGTLAADSRSAGVIWTLEGSEQLNANLVRFESGEGVEAHVNEEVDVLFMGVTGKGFIRVDGEEHRVYAGTLVFAPRGSHRSTRAASEDFCYLTVHRRRGPLRIGQERQRREVSR